MATAVGYVRARAYSFTILVPEDVHRRVVEILAARGGLDATAEIPNQV
ncbi:MAG: hypothetical protein JW929_00625 [Anaerolineales bacterium]|nr:hypothetical protein [Anaerolineales bacterium]